MSTYWVQGVHTSVCRRAPKPLHFPRGDSPHSTRSPCNLSHRPPVSVIWVNECIAYTSFGPHPDSYEQRRTIHRTQSGHVDRCLYTSSSVLPFTSDLQTNSLTLPCFHFPRLWNGVIIPSLEEYAEGQMRCCLHWALKDIRVVCLEDYGSGRESADTTNGTPLTPLRGGTERRGKGWTEDRVVGEVGGISSYFCSSSGHSLGMH